jgi:hypothetical protein
MARITTSSCDEPAPGDLEGVHVVAGPALGELDHDAVGRPRVLERRRCAEQRDALYFTADMW